VLLAACAVAPAQADPPLVPEIAARADPAPPQPSPSIVVEPVEAATLAGYEASTLEMTVVARVREATEVFSAPGAATPMLVIPATTVLGTETVMDVARATDDGWLEVMLPIRPNGSTGWVRRGDVTLFAVDGKLVVDLSERRITYIVDDEEIFSSEIAVGRSSSPTPTGLFYVTDRVTILESSGPWGPHALGLSARSDTITEYNGGDGIIGIHGTNNPSSIGHAASLGCVRLSNDMIATLFPLVRVGTPVEIRA
jgi:hypothetical protein